MKKAAIGIDIGGTSIKLGLVSDQGKILSRSVFMTKDAPGRAKMIKTLVTHITNLQAIARREKYSVRGVGIGAPGPIDVERGFVYFFPNISGWKNTPLKAMLERRLKMPVYVDNDANAMAYGEFRFGAGRGSKNILALTLGTGVGGGIVMNGKLFHGPAYSAAEVGHMVINENGPLCGCGNRGCIETYVGNGHFTREVAERLKKGSKSLLNRWLKDGKKQLTPLLVAQAARCGDQFAYDMWREVGEHLGTFLVGMVNVLNPEKIIIGGGLAQNRGLLFGHVIDCLNRKAFPIAARSVKVVPAELGVDAGLIGSASLAFAN